jgi:hypothetical protein
VDTRRYHHNHKMVPFSIALSGDASTLVLATPNVLEVLQWNSISSSSSSGDAPYWQTLNRWQDNSNGPATAVDCSWLGMMLRAVWDHFVTWTCGQNVGTPTAAIAKHRFLLINHPFVLALIGSGANNVFGRTVTDHAGDHAGNIPRHVDPIAVAQKVVQGVYHGVTTTELDEYVVSFRFVSFFRWLFFFFHCYDLANHSLCCSSPMILLE